MHPNPPLADSLRIGGVWRDVAAGDIPQVMASVASRLPGADPQVAQLLAQFVLAPGALHWAAVGDGLAMPHVRVPGELGPGLGVLAILLLRDPAPLPEPTPDGHPVRCLLFFVAPSARAHLEMVGQLSAHLMRGRLKALLAERAPDEALLAALVEPPPAANRHPARTA